MHKVHPDLRQHIGVATNDVGNMGQAVTCRVHHLPFVHHVVDILMLEAEAPLQQLVVEGIETFVVDIIDLGIETIAGMFGERTHFMVLNHLTKVIGAEGSVTDAEEILFPNVEGFSFVSRIG